MDCITHTIQFSYATICTVIQLLHDSKLISTVVCAGVYAMFTLNMDYYSYLYSYIATICLPICFPHNPPIANNKSCMMNYICTHRENTKSCK